MRTSVGHLAVGAGLMFLAGDEPAWVSSWAIRDGKIESRPDA
jgi:hypothetical protein